MVEIRKEVILAILNLNADEQWCASLFKSLCYTTYHSYIMQTPAKHQMIALDDILLL